MHSIFVKLHRKTYPFDRNVSSLLENQCETPEKHWHGNVSTPTCDGTMHKMVVPYSSNVCENSLVQWNVWMHRLPRENVSTMSPALVGRNFSSVDILLTFTLCQCNVMTLLNNLRGTGAWLRLSIFLINKILIMALQDCNINGNQNCILPSLKSNLSVYENVTLHVTQTKTKSLNL